MFKTLLLLLFMFTLLNAKVIEIDASSENRNILKYSMLGINEAELKPYNSEHINLGFSDNTVVWLEFELRNTTSSVLNKRLVLDNPLLESIKLYDAKSSLLIEHIGILNFPHTQSNLNPSFKLELAANSVHKYRLRVENRATALQFSLCLKNELNFAKSSQNKILMVAVFLGIIISLFITNLFLSVFLQDKTYGVYALYLVALIYQQITYLGVTPLLFSADFVAFDNSIVVFKVNLMIIFASLFAITFLKTARYGRIDKMYKLIIIIALIEIPLFGSSWLYLPEIPVLTGLVFIVYNLFSAIYIYRSGCKQARFFVVAWSFLVLGFLMMILDALGLISVMYYLPSFIMIVTALEAILLSLAFTDRYSILRTQKERLDVMMLKESQEREVIISKEITAQTKLISSALEDKKVLLKELHHRTKNNLQLILSIVRMQADGSEHPIIKERFEQLESRIRAISKTHEILYLSDDFEYIDMREYIYELCADIEEGYEVNDFRIEVEVGNVNMPLREAVYIGLIINELLTNSIKYAQCEGKKIIGISLVKNKDYFELSIGDNGQGYDFELLSGNTLGLTLVKTLVEVQLEGEMKIEKSDEMQVDIRFKL